MRYWSGILCLLAIGCGGSAVVSTASNDSCAGCHPAQAEEFSLSAHARAATSSVFVALREQSISDLGEDIASFCNTCHQPEGGTPEGLGCLSCHAAIGNMEAQNGQLIRVFEGTILARRHDSPTTSSGIHKLVRNGFLGSSELCGTCHQIDGPAGFKESPLTHFLASPATAEGTECSDCHFGAEPGQPEERELRAVALEGSREVPRANHQTIGLGGPQAKVISLLRQALRFEREGETIYLVAGSVGHHVPDGASFLRRLWVEEQVKQGTIWVAENTVLELGAQLLDTAGEEVFLPSRAKRVRERGLLPQERKILNWSEEEGRQKRLCLIFLPYRRELLQALSLPLGLAGTPREIRCLSL